MPDRTLQLASAPAEIAREPAPAPAGLAVGALLDERYRIARRLGAGGMGTVYEAENVRIGRRVAIKVLHPEFARSRVDVERFQREAQIAVRLGSPHVVEVLDFGRTAEGSLYLVMELLRGESVGARLARDGRLPPERVTDLMRQLLTGLAAAHDAGIVHRDLKPENLWLTAGGGGERLKILDFGIAKVADLPEGAARTQVGLVVGTPEYLSPEQAVGGAVDARSDLYSAGIIAWVLLTGRHPFPRESARELVRAHAFEPVPPPDREVPELAAHPSLLRFVARATEKDPAARAQSAQELLAILDGREAVLRWTSTASARARTGAGACEPADPAPPPPRTLSGLLRPTATLPRAVGTTVLVTEIVGYAELEGALSADALARLLRVHDEIVLPAIRAFQGRPVRSRRETALAAFPSPTNAILSGMAIQDRLAGRPAAPAGPAFALRVGIHLGEARPEGGDLVGEAVDLALAVRGAAEPGDVALSRTVYLAMNHSEVPVEPRPAIAHPQRDEPLPLYRVERVPGPLPYGGREAGRVATSDRVAQVLGPIADGLASIEEGAAEGRGRAALRVVSAGTGLMALRCVDVGARATSGALAVVSWVGYRRRPIPAALARLTRQLDALREWVRQRRPVHRAALSRPLR
jgi:class 3 adenylate cyclase/tRNA A-37 threonylcarbamoyl transferase component Bud32